MTALPDKITINIGPQGGVVEQRKPLSLVKASDPILREVAAPVDMGPYNYIDNSSLVQVMHEIVKMHNAHGLAAPQVGLLKRVFVISLPPDILMQTQMDNSFFNPEIVGHSTDTVIMEEGCLSFPFVIHKVDRWKSIKLAWTSLNGERKEAQFNGMTARVMQHELDHLNGKTLFDYMTPLEAMRAREKAAKILKKAIRHNKP